MAKPTGGDWAVGEFVPSDLAGPGYIGIGNGSTHIARAMVTGCVPLAEARENARVIAKTPALRTAAERARAALSELTDSGLIDSETADEQDLDSIIDALLEALR